MTLSRMELKKLRSLKTKKGRRELKLFLGEGVRLLEEAWRHNIRPEILYYTPDVLSERGEKLLLRMAKKNIRQRQISSKQLDMITETKTPQGIVGLFAIPEYTIEQLYDTEIRNMLLCEHIADPGNMGTLLRSALAFGFESVLLCGNCAEPYAPKVVRSSVGALFGLRIVPVTYGTLEVLLQQQNITAVASDIAGVPWQKVRNRIKRSDRCMLMIGSEAEGLSEELKKMAHVTVRINHTKKVESLNAAIAGSILMKQIYDMT